MAKLFALGICVLALYFFISDYAFATVARMTNDPSWLTQSYKRDRVLNGMEFSAKPYEDSSGNVYLHVTYVNPTRYTYTLNDVMMVCGGITVDGSKSMFQSRTMKSLHGQLLIIRSPPMRPTRSRCGVVMGILRTTSGFMMVGDVR